MPPIAEETIMDAAKRRNLVIILILGALSTISPFSIDMYLAAFPQMAADLDSSVAQVSLSLSSYFIGLAAGQVVYGPLLDHFGRKKPLYAGLALFILASLGCMTAKSVAALIAFRFFQALGGCAAQVASMAMVRDFFPVQESAKVFSLLILILGVSPLLAPTAGSLVSAYFSWQWIFALLAVIVALIMAVAHFHLPESHKPDPGIRLELRPVIRTFIGIMATPHFAVCALAGALSFAGLFAYVAGSPLIFMDVYHVGPRFYGMIFALLSVGFIGSSQLNILFSRRFSSRAIFAAALCVQSAVALAFLAGAAQGWLGLYSTVALLFLFLACVGLVSPNATALALAPFEKNAGSASALLGLLQIGLGALASAGVGVFDAHGILPVISIFAGSTWAGALVLLLGRKMISREAAFAAAVPAAH
jgi:DHA1 family bicyclomycin/chloramphenicol resistance-like MFS transporter